MASKHQPFDALMSRIFSHNHIEYPAAKPTSRGRKAPPKELNSKMPERFFGA
jgi:hypothetical protein